MSGGGFWAGLAGGFGTGLTIGEKFKQMGMQADIANVPGQDSTPVASGQEAAAAGTKAYQDQMDRAQTDEEKKQVEQNFRPTLDALQNDATRPASVAYSLGTGQNFRQANKPFSTDEIATQQSTDRQSIYRTAGRPDLANEELRAERDRRALSDDAGIRSATRAGMSDATASGQPMDPVETYTKKIAPRVMQTYLEQGDVKAAKNLAEFVDSQQGQAYTKAWAGAMRKVSAGDFDGAIPDLVKLYDSQPDGKHVTATSLGDGNYKIDWINSADGTLAGSKTLSAQDLAHSAVTVLAPEKQAEFLAKSNEQREREGATLDRQLQLDKQRQEGQDRRDDRRDQRLQTRLDAQDRSLGRRLDAAADRGFTTQQMQKNDSIQAAREQMTGLSPADVLRKTQSTTATGRVNPDYDPQLARTVRLANTRKFGDDPEHDAYSQAKGVQNTDQAARGDVAARFRSDPKMNSMTLGQVTPRGIEVKDKTGKLVGYYQ